MKNWLCIGLLFLSTALTAQIRVSSPVQDLGDIFEGGGLVTSKFQLTNPYREDTIRIVDIETSCGCTVVLTQDTMILPRSTIELEFSYDPAGRLGLFVKSIELTTVTGKNERNKLFLKLMGNVVAENYTVKKIDAELKEYLVAPIYFYPITPYDTSYLDFNYISTFINDLTYEIDFFQFTTIGLEIEIADQHQIPEYEYLLKFVKNKLVREFGRRGFTDKVIFFEEPVFTLTDELPVWASASLRLYSSNFDAENASESTINVTTTEEVEKTKMLLDYQRFALPEIAEIVEQVNFETIEGKLFMNGELNLKGMILMPKKKGSKLRIKTAKKLKKELLKYLKQTTGAGKKEVTIDFDSLGIHPENKYRFVIWDSADEQEGGKLTYELKEDIIVPPLLPTYRQNDSCFAKVDTSTAEFKHFWENYLRNCRSGKAVELLMEVSLSNNPMSNRMQIKQWADTLQQQLYDLFCEATGGELNLKLKTILHGPHASTGIPEELVNYEQYNYFKLIPLTNNGEHQAAKKVTNYTVNFDYYFNGININSFGFQQFASQVAETVMADGFIELRIESGISRIPVEDNKPNIYIAYSRLLESQRRFLEALKMKLVDPNRIIFTAERSVEQGPDYDGTIPVLQYRKYHYLRIIPEKSLRE